MKCKDIPDLPVLRFLADLPRPYGTPGWGTWYWGDDYRPENSVARAMPEVTPEKLVRAKMAMMIRRGVISGCACGCVGSFEITEKGEAELAAADADPKELSNGKR